MMPLLLIKEVASHQHFNQSWSEAKDSFLPVTPLPPHSCFHRPEPPARMATRLDVLMMARLSS